LGLGFELEFRVYLWGFIVCLGFMVEG
jgi:hypothetical protein